MDFFLGIRWWGTQALPPPPWVLGSSWGTLELLGFDATAVVIDRVIELKKSSSALIVGVRVKLTVRLFMF